MGVNMRAHWNYFKYVVSHKWFVFLACLDMGVPLLIALFHDWDKFLPDEWFPYVHTFYAPDGTKQYKESPAFTKAWLLHQNRNKHHWQFWMITWDRGTTECLPMPDVFRREMIADWIGAGKALGFPKTWEWYAKNRNNIQLHPDTRIWVDEQIKTLESTFNVKERVAKLKADARASAYDPLYVKSGLKEDADAIRSDWEAVGKDIHEATERYKKEHGIE